MSAIYTYVGIGFLAIGIILLFVDSLTYKKRREKKKAEIESDFN